MEYKLQKSKNPNMSALTRLWKRWYRSRELRASCLSLWHCTCFLNSCSFNVLCFLCLYPVLKNCFFSCVLSLCFKNHHHLLLLSAAPIQGSEDLAVFYAGRNLLIVGNLARPFNVLGCTLEGNQLKHCAAKPIVQVAVIAKTSGFFTPVVLRSRYESDALPTELLGLLFQKLYVYSIIRFHTIRFDFIYTDHQAF